ncbi:DUF1178 family protein [Hydrogenophaga aquatica]
MKVLNLACAEMHLFEGWFASEEDFQTQLARGMLECPVCGDKHIEKRLSAPRINLGQRAEPQPGVAATPAAVPDPAAHPQLQAVMLQALREVMSRTEDVGERFVTEVRRMHQGEIEHRGIRGRATLEDARELREEGIDVVPLPDLPLLKETLQ